MVAFSCAANFQNKRQEMEGSYTANEESTPFNHIREVTDKRRRWLGAIGRNDFTKGLKGT